jgi:hypothetical protein
MKNSPVTANTLPSRSALLTLRNAPPMNIAWPACFVAHSGFARCLRASLLSLRYVKLWFWRFYGDKCFQIGKCVEFLSSGLR